MGSIASSGSPPLPQIARTPYCTPSGSVKRTMRADVVVPMQTGSYRPSPTLRTPGAVWSRNAPFRSQGGSTPWSKMRIWVRSRMPTMWPSTTTSWPARSVRISASVVGKVRRCEATASCLPVVVDDAVCRDVRGGTAGGPALVVDRDGVQRHVGVGVLDVDGEDRHVAAESHRAYAGFVQQVVEIVLELGHLGVLVVRPDRPCNRLLCQVHGVVGRAAEADADDPRRTRLSARSDDRLEHELLDPAHAVGR